MFDEFEDALDVARALLAENEGTGDVWEANEYVNEALAIRPSDPEAWLIKCQVMSALDDEPAALACVEMALRRAPRSSEVHYWRAAVLANMERYEDALKSLERAFRCMSNSDEWLLEDLFYEKGTVLEAIGHNEEAVAAYQAGLARFPDSQILRAGLEPLHREQVRSRFTVLQGGLS